MKILNILAILAMLGMALVSCFAPAAESADLGLTGNVTTGACTPGLSVSDVDFGNISTAALTNTFSPAEKETVLTVTCPVEMLVAMQMIDNRGDSLDLNNDGVPAPSTGTQLSGFGLGFADQAKSVALGYMQIALGTTRNGASLNPTIDSNPSQVLYTPTLDGENTQWRSGGSNEAVNGNTHMYFSWAKQGDPIVPETFKSVVMPMSVQLFLNAANILNISNDVPIDGSITLALVYL